MITTTVEAVDAVATGSVSDDEQGNRVKLIGYEACEEIIVPGCEFSSEAD